MARDVEQDWQKLQSDLAQLRADVTSLAETLKSTAGDVGKGAAGQARASVEGMRVHAKETAESVARQVEERPFTSVLVALGIGFVLGAMFDHRRA